MQVTQVVGHEAKLLITIKPDAICLFSLLQKYLTSLRCAQIQFTLLTLP